jgi:hypothetical protein
MLYLIEQTVQVARSNAELVREVQRLQERLGQGNAGGGGESAKTSDVHPDCPATDRTVLVSVLKRELDPLTSSQGGDDPGVAWKQRLAAELAASEP